MYDLAVQLQRLIVTYNAKDFREFAKRNSHTGVIAVSANVPLHQIDTNLTALLMRSSEKALQGKYIVLLKEAAEAA